MEGNPTGQAQCQDQDLLAIIDGLNKNIDQLKQQITVIESPVYDKYRATLIAKYDEQMSLMKADAALYGWQNRASDVMMWIVVAVVVAGVVFSGFQLYRRGTFGPEDGWNIRGFCDRHEGYLDHRWRAHIGNVNRLYADLR